MQNNPPSPNAPKRKQPRWRDLTDEEQWAKIYEGRESKRRAAPKSVRQAVGLALPSYVMHMAVADCHATFQATIRHDVHTAIVSGIAKVAALLPERQREPMAVQLQKFYDEIRRKGFYLHNREFLYCAAHATVKLADDWRYPADSPATMAAIMLKEDAEEYDQGDWALGKAHAFRMAGECYNAFIATELYGHGDEVAKRIEAG